RIGGAGEPGALCGEPEDLLCPAETVFSAKIARSRLAGVTHDPTPGGSVRLRRLVVLSLAFALASASPALAQQPPPGATVTAPPQVESPPPSPEPESAQDTPPPESASADRPALEKLESGLDRAATPERAIVELRGPEQAAPVAERAEELPGADVVLRPEDTSFIVVRGDGASLAELAED